MATRTSTSVRLDPAQMSRLDRIVDAMRCRLAGLDVGRSTALRLALERGMDALEAELGLTARRRAKAKKASAKPTKPASAKRKAAKPKRKSRGAPQARGRSQR